MKETKKSKREKKSLRLSCTCLCGCTRCHQPFRCLSDLQSDVDQAHVRAHTAVNLVHTTLSTHFHNCEIPSPTSEWLSSSFQRASASHSHTSHSRKTQSAHRPIRCPASLTDSCENLVPPATTLRRKDGGPCISMKLFTQRIQ